MTEQSIPHSGKTTGDAGPYSSSDWARLWRTLYSGILRDDASVIPNTGNGVDDALWVEQTSPASTQVQVNIGNALVKGYWYQTDAIVNVQISPNTDASGDDRIDLIILRLDVTNQDVRIEVLEGTVAPVPVAPTLTQNATIWEVPIAQIAVTNSFVTIVNADIDNTVRTWFALLDPKIGGTGKAQYDWTHREMLEGGSDLQLSTGIHSGAMWGLSGDSTNFGNGSYADIGSTGGSSMALISDPDSLLTSVGASGAIFAQAGLYRIGVTITDILDVGSGVTIGLRIRNVTQGVTIGGAFTFTRAAEFTNIYFEGFAEIAVSDEIRIQGLYSGGGGTAARLDDTAGGATGGTVAGETTRSLIVTAERISQGA